MKKRISLFVTLAIFMLMPITIVRAEDQIDPGSSEVSVTVSLDCSNPVKKGKSVNCNVKANISGGILKKLAGKVRFDSNYFDGPQSFSFDQDDYKTGTIGTFTLTAKNTAVKNQKVTLYDITGTAEEGKTVKFASTTNIESGDIVILNNDNFLKDIKIDVKSIAGFDRDKTAYDIKTTESSILIDGDLSDSNAKLSGNGKQNIACGTNKFKLSVTAEDGSIKDYNLTVTRECNKSTELKNITLSSGTLSPAFKASTNSYNVTVKSEIDFLKITAVKGNDKQTISGDGEKKLKYGDNTIIITVTAENGFKSSYTLKVKREDNRSKDNSLSDIKLSTGTILFDKDILEYKVKVLNEVGTITITPTATDSKATVKALENQKLVVGENKFEIKVKAENETEKVYTIYVTRLKEGETLGDNPDIESITIKGYDIGFVSGKTDYTLKIEKEEELDIAVVMQDKTSVYQIIGNEKLENGSVIKIETKSQDGSTNSYTITIEKDSDLLLIIGIIAAIVVVSGGIITFIIVKRKNSGDMPIPKEKEDKVKTSVMSDEELLEKVKQQLHEDEPQEAPIVNNLNRESQIKPISIINPIEEPIVKHEEPVKPVELPTAEAPKNNSVFNNLRQEESQENNNSIFNNLRDEETQPRRLTREEIMSKMPLPKTEEAEKNEEQKEATKICSICGHRVPASTKVCPYCRRMW